ncbi:MAG: hypothetical protein ABIS50_16535 [Luteolibacter sp.]|uniref:hypothetical protein n=1 Tax=Luteolibacter sp. TaxID=1962973 RepID=UPI00326533AB
MQAATSPRTKLRTEIEQRFLPLVRERGFKGPTKLNGNRTFHDFIRPTPDGRQCLSIQFEKYRKPRVILDLTIEPPGGFENSARDGATHVQGRVTWKPGGKKRSWFRADRPLWQRLLGRRSTIESAAVAAMISCLEEIDQWWQTQAESTHIRVLRHTYPPPA